MVQHGKFGSTMSALGQKRTLERRLFDYFVGTAKQRWRYGEAECFGSLEVDDQLDSGRRLHRKIGRLLAFEDAIDIAGRTTILDDQAAIGGFVTVREIAGSF